MSDEDFQDTPAWLRIRRAAQAAGIEPADPKSEYDAGELDDENNWSKRTTLPTERARDVGDTMAFTFQNKKIIPKAGLPEGVDAWDRDNGFWNSPEAAQERNESIYRKVGMHSPVDEKEYSKRRQDLEGVPEVQRFRVRNAGEMDEWNEQETANNSAYVKAIRALQAAASATKLKK